MKFTLMLLVALVVLVEDVAGKRCSKMAKRAIKNGDHVPTCNAAGKYELRQCDDVKCWCVNAKGRVTNRGLEIPTNEVYDCSAKRPSDCVSARFVAILGDESNVPRCDDDGNFVHKQCSSTEVQGNLALGKPTSQINNYPGAGPSHARAVDGNTNPNWSGSSCSHTVQSTTNPWWTVDLGRVYQVERVVITNRLDCCTDRLDDAYIGLSDVDPSSEAPTLDNQRVCATVDGSLPPRDSTLSCVGEGRYLTIILEGTRTLTLCEVQVFGAVTECWCEDEAGVEIANSRAAAGPIPC